MDRPWCAPLVPLRRPRSVSTREREHPSCRAPTWWPCANPSSHAHGFLAECIKDLRSTRYRGPKAGRRGSPSPSDCRGDCHPEHPSSCQRITAPVRIGRRPLRGLPPQRSSGLPAARPRDGWLAPSANPPTRVDDPDRRCDAPVRSRGSCHCRTLESRDESNRTRKRDERGSSAPAGSAEAPVRITTINPCARHLRPAPKTATLHTEVAATRHACTSAPHQLLSVGRSGHPRPT